MNHLRNCDNGQNKFEQIGELDQNVDNFIFRDGSSTPSLDWFCHL